VYLRAAAELDSLKSALQREMEKVASTVGTSNDVNVRREAETREALRRQKEKVLQLRAEHDEMAVLQRDVDGAQHAYDQLTLRLSQTGIESQVQSTNVVILEDARVPVKPSSPRILLNTAIGTALGLLLGIASAIGLERLRPRLRSAADVAEFLALPVLGTLAGVGGRKPARREPVPVPA